MCSWWCSLSGLVGGRWRCTQFRICWICEPADKFLVGIIDLGYLRSGMFDVFGILVRVPLSGKFPVSLFDVFEVCRPWEAKNAL